MMLKRYLLFSLIMLTACQHPVVPDSDTMPAVTWDKTIGGSDDDRLNNILETSNGGYLLSGDSRSNVSSEKSASSVGDFDYWIVKITGLGSKQWDKTIGGSQYEGGSFVTQSPDKGFLLGGTSASGISGDKSEETYLQGFDYWIVKVDQGGVKQWDKNLGGNHYDGLTYIVPTLDYGYLLVGYSSSQKFGDKSEPRKAGDGNTDYWVVKISGDGKKQWDRTLGGFNGQTPNCAILTADGGYLIGGNSSSSISGDKTELLQGYTDFWIVKLNSNGQKEWDKTFGGESSESLRSIVATSDGGYLLAGLSMSKISGQKSEMPKSYPSLQKGQNTMDYWLVKIDGDGQKLWDKTIGGNDRDELARMIPTKEGNFMLIGTSRSGISGDKSEASRSSQPEGSRDRQSDDYWVVKINDKGQKLWDKTMGGDAQEIASSIVGTSNGGYLIGGSSLSDKSFDKTEPSRGKYDYWVVKIQ